MMPGGGGTRGLPYHGQIQISAAFIDTPGIANTLAHEIGHVLGFGRPWKRETAFQSLVSGIGTSNPVFQGANATREYKALFGQGVTSVPLYERSAASPPAYDGSYGSHWRDSVFKAANGSSFELMTSAYNVTGSINGAFIAAILSRATVGAMQDLGYSVNYSNAEKYVTPAGSSSGPAPAGGGFGGMPKSRDFSRSQGFFTMSIATGGIPGDRQTACSLRLMAPPIGRSNYFISSVRPAGEPFTVIAPGVGSTLPGRLCLQQDAPRSTPNTNFQGRPTSGFLLTTPSFATKTGGLDTGLDSYLPASMTILPT